MADAAPRPSRILEGPLASSLFHIALPTVGSSLLMSANSFADRLFVGRLGSDALAAVTVVQEVKAGLMTVLVGVSVGAAAIVGRSLGSGALDDARTAARQAIALAVVGSLVVTALLLGLAEPLLAALGLQGDALTQGTPYLRWTLLSVPSLFTLALCNGLYGVMGETKRALAVIAVAVVANILFDWLLIFGSLGAPKMGLPGGGAALCVSQSVATLLFARGFSRTRLAGLHLGSWKPDLEWLKRLTAISAPAVTRQLVATASALGIQALLLRTPSGNAVSAAYGVGFLVESLATLPGNAYAGAASAFVSQNLGAGNPARARGAARSAALQAALAMGAAALLFATFAPQIVHTFLTDPGPEAERTRTLAVAYLRTVAFAEPFAAVALVLSGALNGAGETRTPRTITFATMGLRLALVLLLQHAWGLGPQGAWTAIAATPVLGALLTLAAFRKGKWLQTKV